MYADRVKIFHVTDHDRSIVCVAHHLIFDLFIALHAFFNEYLMDRGKLKRFFHHVVKLRFVVDKSAARAAERESGAQYDRIAYFRGSRSALFNTVCRFGRTYRLAYTFAKLFEKLSVLGALNAFAFCSEKLRTAFAEYAFLFKLHRKVESRLSAESRYYRVGAFEADDLCDVFKSKRFHVDLIGYRRIGHDSRGV